MDSLPRELTYKLLNHLDPNDIRNIAQVNSQFASIIDDQYFWSNKIKLIPDGNLDTSPTRWQQFALSTLYFRHIPIYIEDDDIPPKTYFWINPEHSEQCIMTNLFKIFNLNIITFYNKNERLFTVYHHSYGYRRRKNSYSILNATKIVVDDMPELEPAIRSEDFPIYIYKPFVI